MRLAIDDSDRGWELFGQIGEFFISLSLGKGLGEWKNKERCKEQGQAKIRDQRTGNSSLALMWGNTSITMSGDEDLPGASHELLTFAALTAVAARVATAWIAAVTLRATILIKNGVNGGPFNLRWMSSRVRSCSLRRGRGERLGLRIHVGGSELAGVVGWGKPHVY